MLWWMSDKAGGFGPLLDEPSKLGWGGDFWKLFWPSLMGMIGFWSTLSLNIPDFTRYGRSQKEQIVGQALGLPTTMTLFAFLSVMVTSGRRPSTARRSGTRSAGRQDRQPVGILFALVTVLVATLSVNIAANLVSRPSTSPTSHPGRSPSGPAAHHRCPRRADLAVEAVLRPPRATSSPGWALGGAARHGRRHPHRRLLASAAPSSTSPTCTARAAATGTTAAGTGGLVALVIGGVLAVGGAYSAVDGDAVPGRRHHRRSSSRSTTTAGSSAWSSPSCSTACSRSPSARKHIEGRPPRSPRGSGRLTIPGRPPVGRPAAATTHGEEAPPRGGASSFPGRSGRRRVTRRR